jgi:hypothetical protein
MAAAVSDTLKKINMNAQVDVSAFSDFFDTQTRGVESGYLQSHPYSVMYTAQDLATDQANLNSNYMRLIFGGNNAPEDYSELNYKHTTRDLAENVVNAENTLGLQTELQFTPGTTEVTNEALLTTFAQQRQFYKGRIDTDTERFMKSRGGLPELQHTTYYGKRNGNFHYLAGQAAPIEYAPNIENYNPVENLSSRTYAPMGMNQTVPLYAENVFGIDPRAVAVTNEPRYIVSEAGVTNANDLGAYYGNEVDRLIEIDVPRNGSIESLFTVFKPRM